MKTKIMITALGMLFAVGAGAQTIYDAADVASKDLNGTARFVGMGGAMGALGGDISTIGTNPAGIGVYRSNDIVTSFGYSSMGVESKYGGLKFNSDKNRWNFDNMGVVFSTKIGNETSLRYVNFGFNYQKSKSFNRNMNMAGDLDGLSQTFQMAGMSDGITPKMWKDGSPFDNIDIGWLSALGYNSYLIDPKVTLDKTDYAHLDGDGKQIFDKDGKPEYLDYDHYVSIAGDYPYLREFRSWESGGINQFDFNVSFNFNDRLYLGMTIGAYDVDYSKSTLYDEDYRTEEGEGTGSGYVLESRNNIGGAGFDFKIGAILRPFEYSPFRIGVALHTPTFYKLTYTTSARLVSDLYFNSDKVTSTVVDSYEDLGGKNMKMEYQLRTPWVYNLSLGYTVGSSLALGAEYEYKDYSSMKLQDVDGYNMDWENNEVKKYLKGVSTFRIGAEYKVTPAVALRLGYNYSSSAYNKDAVKDLPVNSIHTDTDFLNAESLSNYTLGVGYRGKSFYADLAYQYSAQKADFYPFVNKGISNEGVTLITPVPTKVTNSRSRVICTVGFRF